jgi:ubiquitin C-terminal hydrolase
MGAIYPGHCLSALEIVPKYNLKAVITFYGEHYMAYVNTKDDWMRYNDRQVHCL